MDDRAFLAAVIADPDDDAPRLIYADWLDENGQPERAEFIRLQCDLARKERYDPSRLPLEERERALLLVHGVKWAAPVRTVTGEYTFKRGFIDKVSIGARKFLTHGTKLFELTPIQTVRLTRIGSSNVKPADLARFGHLSRIRGLELQGELNDELCEFIAAPELKNLRALTLERGFSIQVLDSLLAGSWPKLESLNLDVEMSILTTEHVERLANSRWTSSLRHLNLNGHAIKVDGAKALAASKRVKNLERLGLKRCGVGLAGTQALAGASTLSNLRLIDLRSNRLTENAARALAESSKLPALRELFLGMNEIGPDGVRALANWPGLANLRMLHLYGCPIGDEGASALADSPHVANLWCLDVTQTDITDRGRKALAESPYLKNVRMGSFPGEW